MNEIKEGEVIVLHMVNGTNVVGQVDSFDEDSFTLKRPQELLVGPGPQGLRVGFAPFLSCGGIFPELETAMISYADILMPRLVPEKLETAYREAVGLVQVVAKPSIILSN